MHASIKKLIAALAATVFGAGSVNASILEDDSTGEKTVKQTPAKDGSMLVAQAVDIDTFLKSYAGTNRPVVRQRKTRTSAPPRTTRARRGDY